MGVAERFGIEGQVVSLRPAQLETINKLAEKYGEFAPDIEIEQTHGRFTHTYVGLRSGRQYAFFHVSIKGKAVELDG